MGIAENIVQKITCEACEECGCGLTERRGSPYHRKVCIKCGDKRVSRGFW